jgi:hypothetical protein
MNRLSTASDGRRRKLEDQALRQLFELSIIVIAYKWCQRVVQGVPDHRSAEIAVKGCGVGDEVGCEDFGTARRF